MSNEKWIDDLRKSVQGHSTTPPDNLWAGISAGISGATQKPTPKREAVNPRWTWVGIAAALALLVGIGVLWTHTSEEALEPIIITATNETETNQPTIILKPAEEVADASTPSSKVAPDRIKKAISNRGNRSANSYSETTSSASNSRDAKDSLSENETTSQTPETTAEEQPIQKQETPTISENNETKISENKPKSDPFKDFDNRSKSFKSIIRKSAGSGRIQLSLAGSGANFETSIANNAELPFSSVIDRGDEPSKIYKSAALPIDELFEKLSTSRHHHRPLTLGLYVRGDVYHKLGLEGGVLYHRLYSTFDSPRHSSGPTGNQTLEYIGIPLSLTYPIWEGGRLSLFASAGGQLAINVKRSVDIDNIEDVYLLNTNNKFAHTLDKAQWSLNAGIGLQYNILSRIGLFVQPQVNYYINNGSPVETIYKTTPLNVSINAGLKIDVGRLHR